MPAARRPGARRVLGAAVLTAAIAAGMNACSGQNGGQALAQEACVHVHRSVQDWLRSVRSGTPQPTIVVLQTDAAQQLRQALPLAAAANSDDGSWNALMTTISESAWIDESHLVPSLDAQCSVANANANVNPQSPGGNVNPKSTSNVNPRSP